MEGYGAATYGERTADIYDRLYVNRPELSSMVAALEALAGGGRALEMGIGTGMVAIPLRDRGIDVEGVEVSAQMLEKLRAKQGGADIRVYEGHCAEVQAAPPYDLVYIVFNTMFMLPTQEEQIGCFTNVARLLAPGGRFVVEAFVPDSARFGRPGALEVVAVQLDHLEVDVFQHDPVTQVVNVGHVMLDGGRIMVLPEVFRYAMPSELDLMARLVGLRLSERWDNWEGGLFGVDSRKHVSIYALEQ